MSVNLTPDRRFALSVAGTVIIALMIVWALAPRKMRAHVTGAFSKMGASPSSSVTTDSSETSRRKNSTASARREQSSDYWPAGSLFEAPPNEPARGWSPAGALARSVFGESDRTEKEPFLLAGLLSGPSGDGDYSAPSGGSSGQQGSGTTGGYTAGGNGLAGGAGGSSGSAAGGAYGSGNESAKQGDSSNSRNADSDSSSGLPATGAKSGAPGNSTLDSKSGAGTPLSAAKATVTGTDDPYAGLPAYVMDAPMLNSGSGPHTQSGGQGSGNNGWVPGTGGTGDQSLDTGGAGPYNPGGGDPPAGGGKKGHKGPPSGSSDYSGTQDWPAVTEFADTINPPGYDEPAVPEPGALVLFATALVGIVVLRLRSPRKA